MSLSFGQQLLKRFGRGSLGLAIGWALSSFIGLIWCGIGIAWYGDLDEALSKLKSEPFAHLVFGGIIAGMMGSWIAAGVGPTVLGPCRLRRPVLTTALVSGVAAALTSTGVGVFVADTIAKQFPKSEWVILGPLALSVLLGILAGWRIGSHFTDASLPNNHQFTHQAYDEYDPT